MSAGFAAAGLAGHPGRHLAVIHLPADKAITVGRSTECDVIISHSTVSRRHANLTLRNDQIWLEDLDTTHGTYVNDAPIRKVLVRQGDVVRFGSGPTYRFAGDSLNTQDGAGGMQIELSKIEVERGGRKLLEDICVSIAPGSFVGILGPSGAGKSLMLHCLASTLQPTRGEVLFDGGIRLPDAIDDFRGMIGVVTQEDLVYGYLTVDENLSFSAQLRMPVADRSAIERHVNEALELMDLQSHRHKRVDVLSGGQRKRVGVAIELLLRPRLLLLDEPTSGLDPGTAALVMSMLRRLSRQGITVVCTTHTTETLHFFDTTIVLGIQASMGRIAFHGAPGELLPRFGVENAADLFDRLQTLDRNHVATAEPRAISGTRSTGAVRPISPRHPAGAWSLARQMGIVAYRSVLGCLRDRVNLIVTLAQPLVLSLVIVFSQHAHSESIFIHFFLLISALWLGMTLTVREIVRERALYVRDRIACLSPDAYIAGKLIYALALCLAQSIILLVAARIFVCLMISNDSFAINILKGSWMVTLTILTVCSMGGAVIGFVISVIASSERAAVAMLPLAILPQMLLSRVSFGDGPEGWTEISPLGPVISVSHYLHSNDAIFLGRMESILSLALLSRPGTAVLDMPIQPGIALVIIGTEWLYFLLLLLVHFLALYVLFVTFERKWLKLR